MGTELVVQNVDFYGSELLAIKDNVTNTIYTAINYVLKGIGFTDMKQIEYQRDKMCSDKVISKGIQKFSGTLVGAKTGKDTLCINIRKLPYALAKINITPSMEEKNPQMVANLERYQDECADVLAKVFIEKKQLGDITPLNYDLIQQMFEQQSNMLNNTLITFTNAMKEFVDQQNKSLQSFAKMISMQNVSLIKEDITPLENTSTPAISLAGTEFKRRIYELCDEIVKYSDFEASSLVLSHVYRLINRKYGICWDQEIKDYKQAHDLDKNPSLISVIANSDDGKYLKSILLSILEDMSCEYKSKTQHGNNDETETQLSKCCIAENWDDAQRLTLELAKQLNDNSPYAIVTYTKLYKLMEENNKINWTYYRSYYKRMNNIHNRKMKPAKKVLISSNSKLQNMFITQLNNKMQEVMK